MAENPEQRGPEQIPLPDPADTGSDGTGQGQALPQPQVPPLPMRLPTPLVLQAQRKQALEALQQSRKQTILNLIAQIEAEHGNSNVIVYYSRNLLNGDEVNWIYQLFAGVDCLDNVDLFLLSPGGIANDAYKMGRLIREHCKSLRILIPYTAKSAATLLALAGDEIVMGPASELGPIDPQIPIQMEDGRVQYVPALSIKEGLDFFEKRVKADPDTFPLYYRITNELSPLVVGSYVRAIESAKQYAKDFLLTYMLSGKASEANKAAETLTEKYLSHSYVIDRRMARDEIGLNATDASTTLWSNMWDLHCHYDLMLQENPQLGSIIQSRNMEFSLKRNF